MSFKIKPQANEFDDNFLNVVGNEFKFDHVKGLAEWIKNSADAYTRREIPDEDQFIFLRFTPKKGDKQPYFECIDFVGMAKKDIDSAFKRWGDPNAAKRGTNRRVLGGHGNGGKFYMRQMFKTSRFITYRDGLLNVFGFNESKKYGYAEGYENLKMPAPEALKFAGISGVDVPKAVRERWAKKGEGVGFTVLIGEAPDRLRHWTQVRGICDKLKVHPQSRRLVKFKEIFVMAGGEMQGTQLLPEEIPPRPGFEGPFKIDVPKTLEYDGETFEYRNSKYKDAHLVLYTSAQPFGRMGDRASLNSIDILGEVGCIGSYKVNELGFLKYSAQAEFIYGECFCPILEDPADDCVKNDREKLVETGKTKALLNWIKEQVDELCEKLADEERVAEKREDLKQAADFNELLNSWKNQFMNKLFSEVLGGPGQGDSIGGAGGGNNGNRTKKGSGNDGEGKAGDEGDNGGGSGTESKKAPRFPRVLLSGIHADPLNPESPTLFQLDPRHPPVYQRPEDVQQGIYWINTSRPLAQRILEQYKVESTRWREYHFQRFVDIIVKEALYQKARKEPNLTAETVDQLIVDIVSRVHDAAAVDLEQFLFDEVFGAGVAA